MKQQMQINWLYLNYHLLRIVTIFIIIILMTECGHRVTDNWAPDHFPLDIWVEKQRDIIHVLVK